MISTKILLLCTITLTLVAAQTCGFITSCSQCIASNCCFDTTLNACTQKFSGFSCNTQCPSSSGSSTSGFSSSGFFSSGTTGSGDSTTGNNGGFGNTGGSTSTSTSTSSGIEITLQFTIEPTKTNGQTDNFIDIKFTKRGQGLIFSVGAIAILLYGLCMFRTITKLKKNEPYIRELLEYEQNSQPATMGEAIHPDLMEVLRGSMTSVEMNDLRWVGAPSVRGIRGMKSPAFIAFTLFVIFGITLTIVSFILLPDVKAAFPMMFNLFFLCIGLALMTCMRVIGPANALKGDVYAMTSNHAIICRVKWRGYELLRFPFRSGEYRMSNPLETNEMSNYGSIIFAEQLHVNPQTSHNVHHHHHHNAHHHHHNVHHHHVHQQKRFRVEKIGFHSVSRFDVCQQTFHELHAHARNGMPYGLEVMSKETTADILNAFV